MPMPSFRLSTDHLQDSHL
uniref:Uncharacterized protein n=1 Tax=Arundo donax TaxID=35708 RepID=A0A0A9AXQ4_ARUDO